MRLPARQTTSVAAVLVFLVVGWWAFTFAFFHTGFANDDFEHLSKARQVLFGELPDRDFYDDGRPLTIALSAAAQYLDPTLLSELWYRAVLLGAAAALVYLLTVTVSRSIILGVLVSLASIASRPRLYNYSKLFAFPFGLWLLWRYVDRPSRGRLAALTAATVAAFFFRNDYGVYIGVVSAITILVVHRREAFRPLAFYVVLGLVMVSPYLAWLAAHARLASTGTKGVSSIAAEMPIYVRRPFSLTHFDRLISIRAPESQVGVRWRTDVDGTLRGNLEQRYGLTYVDRTSDERTFVYVLDDPTPEHIRRLLEDPRVEDTSGIDRSRADRSRWIRWEAAVPLLRLTITPIFPSPSDAGGFLYNLCFFSVPLALATLAIFGGGPIPHGGAKVLSLALLCLLIHQFLLLDQIDTHLPNVTGFTLILVAWMVRRAWDAVRALSRPLASLAGTAWLVAVPALALTTWASITTLNGTTFQEVIDSGLAGRAAFREQIHETHIRPLDYWSNAGSTGTAALIRYVERCLAPNDRVLIVAFAPEVPYLSERLFAGGVNSYHGNHGFNSSGAEILQRMRRQSVPLVVINTEFDNYARDWGEVAQYLSASYREAAVTNFKDPTIEPYRLLVDRQRPLLGTDVQWGLPCYVRH